MENLVNSFKEVMGNYPSGVTVLTAYNNEINKPVGLTANSFISVSIDPILVLFCIDEKSSSLESFKKAKSYGINILSAEQEEQCFHFAKRIEDKFEGQDWTLSELNVPILQNSSAVLQCEKYDEFALGDHTVFVGKVVDIENNERKSLIYLNGEVYVV